MSISDGQAWEHDMGLSVGSQMKPISLVQLTTDLNEARSWNRHWEQAANDANAELARVRVYLETAQRQLDKVDEHLPVWKHTGRGRVETIDLLVAERDEAQQHCRDHHIEDGCLTCMANESELIWLREQRDALRAGLEQIATWKSWNNYPDHKARIDALLAATSQSAPESN